MKKIFTLFALISLGILNAQSPSLQAWTTDATGTTALVALSNGTVVSYTVSASSPTLTSTQTVKVRFKNISSTTNTYSVVRKDITLNSASPGANAYFCFGDFGSCYNAFTTEPSSDFTVLAPGASTAPGKQLITDLDEAYTVGYSEVNYKLFNKVTGKTSADTLSFTFRYNQLTGINENAGVLENVSNVYPNPSTNNANITVVLTDEVPVKVQVFNSIGSLVYTSPEQRLMGKNKLAIDCSNFNTGLYFITVTAGNSKVTKRLVVNK